MSCCHLQHLQAVFRDAKDSKWLKFEAGPKLVVVLIQKSYCGAGGGGGCFLLKFHAPYDSYC